MTVADKVRFYVRQHHLSDGDTRWILSDLYKLDREQATINRLVEHHNQRIRPGAKAGHIYLTPIQASIWIEEILGQLSDGAWENHTGFMRVWRKYQNTEVHVLREGATGKFVPIGYWEYRGAPGITRELWGERGVPMVKVRMIMKGLWAQPNATEEIIHRELTNLQKIIREGHNP